MRKYIYEIYRDKGGIGEERMFDSQNEAVEYSASEWDKLTGKEKKATDICRVYEIEISAEAVAAYNDGELECTADTLWTADVWSAKQEA